MVVQKPTPKLVARYINEFNTNIRYYPADIAINNLIDAFPENHDVHDVMLKVATINALYSTRIMNVVKMSYYIASLDIDSKLDAGDLTVVEDIATGHGLGRGKNGSRFFSFATKYCNWHKKNIYPIFDSFVEKILISFRDKFHFSSFMNYELKYCESLKQIIIDFQNTYSLSQYNFKEIDKFLWRYGQVVFPAQYEK